MEMLKLSCCDGFSTLVVRVEGVPPSQVLEFAAWLIGIATSSYMFKGESKRRYALGLVLPAVVPLLLAVTVIGLFSAVEGALNQEVSPEAFQNRAGSE